PEVEHVSPSTLLVGTSPRWLGRRGRRRNLLRVVYVPTSAEGLVELHVGREPAQPDLRLEVLGWVEPLQRLEDFVVARKPVDVAIPGYLDGLLERLHGPDLLRLRPGQLLQSRKARGHFLESLDHGLLVLPLRLFPGGDRGAIVPEDLAALEN